jgi:Pyruvate kinase, barrel domain
LPIKTTFDLPDPAAVFDGRGDAANQHTSCFPLAKIVATIGPTSEQKQPLLDVSAAGMRIMRLNFSHATVEEVELRVANLAAAQVCMLVAVV